MLRSTLTACALCALCALVLATGPAHAVVGGTPVRPEDVPYFVGTGICGGTLIAPDRVVTAAHCVDPVLLSDLDALRIGTETRRAVRVALPSSWERRRDGFMLDDIAVVQLDRPVTSVRPVALPTPNAATPARVSIVGRGQINAPPPGRPAAAGLYPLRRATLRSVRDGACDRTWRRSRDRLRAHFEAPLMLCATDAGGPRPFSSVCAGDSGGPLLEGRLDRPTLIGVISWTGARCGADGLPSVAAEVDRYRDLLTDPAPAWAPVPASAPQITGPARIGGTLRCAVPAWEVAPSRVTVRWFRRVRGRRAYVLREVGRGPDYAPTGGDAGKVVSCQVLGEGPGGRTQAPDGPEAAVRVAG